VRWNQAALENQRRKKQEEEAKQRRKIREEQFQKRLQLGWETPQSVESFNNSVSYQNQQKYKRESITKCKTSTFAWTE